MKPFNLEEAKAGKPVCRRDGTPARIICFDRISLESYPIVALVLIEGSECAISYAIDGRYNADYRAPHTYDLMMAPVKHEGWVNVYKSNDIDEDLDSFALYQMQQGIFETKDEALGAVKKSMKYSTHYIATIKIEWEE